MVQNLVKIRISNHKLMTETERYNQTPHNDRFCPIINSDIIEGEFHFLSHSAKGFNPKRKILQSNPTKFCRF